MPTRNQVWTLLENGLDCEAALLAQQKRPTCPHRHAPAKPGAAVKAAAAQAAVFDKVRDAAADRPADRKGKE